MDYNLFVYINNFVGHWAWLDSLAIFFAKYLIYFLVAATGLFFFIIKKNKIRYLFLTGLSVILSRLVITELIRLFWHRPRPFIDHQVNLLIGHSASGSFPSGHAAFLFALSTAVFFFNKKLGIVFLIASFFIGLARVFIGVHYPFDILGGMVVGVLSAMLVKIFKKYKNRKRVAPPF